MRPSRCGAPGPCRWPSPISPDALELVVTIDDPEMYQKPFVAVKQVFTRGTEIDEQLCVPSEAQQYLEIMAKPAAGTR